MVHKGSIVILDFGGQYAHLIGSRIRRLRAYSEIREPEIDPDDLKGAAGIILSGGPQSVYEKGSPQANPEILELGIPVLGLCYGHQWVAHALGGTVAPAKTKEYGETEIRVSKNNNPLFKDLPKEFTVWMSHGDEVQSLPKDFHAVASSNACAFAAFAHDSEKIFGIQFHIEVTHTQHGMDILDRFVRLCKPSPWSIESYAKHVGAQIKKDAGDKKVFMLVSGGVDSTVAFTLLNETLGKDRVQGLLVDTGLMRKKEIQMISEAMQNLGITNLHIEDASEEFFANLKGVYEPEAKRKVIGDTFLAVQQRVCDSMGFSIQQPANQQPANASWLLGQGTIYPDTIETKGTKHADHIKTHHNRVPAIQKMMEAGLIIEPLRELYKDEVRKLGEEIGLPHELVWRHPFPGPGLGVRILCAEKESKVPDTSLEISFTHAVLPVQSVGVQGDGRTYRHALALFSDKPLSKIADEVRTLATKIPNSHRDFNRVLLCTSHHKPVDFVFTAGYLTRERADLLRNADAAVDRVMRQNGLYEKIWQFPVVLLPIGINPDGQSIVLRPISSSDAMTANAYYLPDDVLEKMTKEILACGIEMVFLDLTNKPPATIEWE